MLTFKRFISEGGAATADWGTQRVNAEDVKRAIELVSQITNFKNLQNNLVGSGELTQLGYLATSGDIDLIMPRKHQTQIHDKMLQLVGTEATLNVGTSIGSYAVDLGSKKVQVDLIYVDDLKWAKFIFTSQHGRKSAYPSAVRNLILSTLVTFIQKPHEDFVVKDQEGNIIARASRSLKHAVGLERLFKVATTNVRTGKRNKVLNKALPQELEKLAAGKTFSKDADIISEPSKVVEWLFGPGVKPKDVETAEQVIALIKLRVNSSDILAKVKEELVHAKLPIPKELRG